jgi:hypothetical protein
LPTILTWKRFEHVVDRIFSVRRYHGIGGRVTLLLSKAVASHRFFY